MNFNISLFLVSGFKRVCVLRSRIIKMSFFIFSGMPKDVKLNVEKNDSFTVLSLMSY